jgi:Mg2+ and Co2+ transporter CorA
MGLENKVLETIKKNKTFPRFTVQNNYVFICISIANFQGGFQSHPLYIAVRDKILLTVRTSNSSRPVEYVLESFEKAPSKMSGADSTLVLCKILFETASSNLDVLLTLREGIEDLEEKAIAEASPKRTVKSVFVLKKQLANFYHLLAHEQQTLKELKDGIIPDVNITQPSATLLSDALKSISEELEFLDYYDSALDGILRLQDLGMIHKVETRLIQLTVVIIIMNVIILAIDLGLIDALLGR